mgnify:CR=1 FL=1
MRMNGSSTSAERGFWAVIPAGGSGTRLWPLSRTARPKFLLPLLGETSLLQDTLHRLQPLAAPVRTLVVCGPVHAAAIARQLPTLPEANIVVEPSPKGSGPAIGLATALIARHDPDALLGSFAADHRVERPEAFVAAVHTAVAAAQAGWLVTIGLTPTRPEIGYGYIERTDEAIVETAGGVAYRAARFVEKPDLATATAYVASGRFLWNASMFVWRARTLLDEMARLQPDLYAGVQRIAAAWDTADQERETAEVWAGLVESTIDHGIMEHAARVAVVPAELGWSDVGDWHGLGELIAQDDLGNSVRGDLVQVDTSRSVVWSETDRVVALVGVDNTVVVDTPDALLVVNRARAQDVKQVVAQLKRARRTELS